MGGRNGDSIIDAGKTKIALAGPQLIWAAGVVAMCSVGWTQLAPRAYVDENTKATDAKIAALATAQLQSVEQIKGLEEASAKQHKRMGLVVRLVSAQYVDRIDEAEAPPARGRRASKPPRSAKAKRVARALQLDPDDPLAGLELSGALEQ